MKTNLFFLFACLAILALAAFVACGDDDDDDNDAADDDQVQDDDAVDDDLADDDTEPDDDAADDDLADDDATPPPGCNTLQEGWNSDFMVDGVARSFILDLPEGVQDSWPWPVVFNWHGFGDTAGNMRTLIRGLVDGPDFPFIGVTIEDSGMMLDWDIFDAMDPNNREARLFDELLAELDKCYGVDPDHVHTMGFSLGSAICCMLGQLRSDVIASVAGCSGGYASNPDNAIPYFATNWPEIGSENKYVELRLHGGILDNMILPFGLYGENDRVWLNENGHDYIDCVHNSLHNMGFLFMDPANFIEFFADHPLGTYESPYATQGLPGDFPDICTFSPKVQ